MAASMLSGLRVSVCYPGSVCSQGMLGNRHRPIRWENLESLFQKWKSERWPSKISTAILIRDSRELSFGFKQNAALWLLCSDGATVPPRSVRVVRAF